MSTPREIILELVSSGKISPAEADQLLATLERPRRPRWRVLVDPVAHLSTPVALGIASATALVGLLLARLGVRFDGALDVHLTGAAVGLRVALVDMACAWPLVALVFWLAARLQRVRPRLVDLVVAVGLARVPLVVFAALALALAPPGSSSSARLVLLALAALPLLGAFVAALATGFRSAAGLRGARWGVTFVIALTVAEVVSTLLIGFLST